MHLYYISKITDILAKIKRWGPRKIGDLVRLRHLHSLWPGPAYMYKTLSTCSNTFMWPQNITQQTNKEKLLNWLVSCRRIDSSHFDYRNIVLLKECCPPFFIAIFFFPLGICLPLCPPHKTKKKKSGKTQNNIQFYIHLNKFLGFGH